MAFGFKSLVLAGTLSAVAFTGVTWAGGDAIDSAKDLITQQDVQLAKFKSNETALVSKLNQVNTTIATLQGQIDAKQAEIDKLILEGGEQVALIQSLTTEKQTLVADLKTATDERDKLATESDQFVAGGETLMEEIVRLEGELNTANDDAEELQTFVDNHTMIEVDQVAVDAALGGAVIEPTPEPNPEPTPPVIEEPTQPAGSTNIKLMTETPQVLSGINDLKIDVLNGQVVLTNTNVTKHYTATIDGVSYTINPSTDTTIGDVAAFDKKVMTIKAYDGIKVGKTYWLTNN